MRNRKTWKGLNAHPHSEINKYEYINFQAAVEASNRQLVWHQSLQVTERTNAGSTLTCLALKPLTKTQNSNSKPLGPWWMHASAPTPCVLTVCIWAFTGVSPPTAQRIVLEEGVYQFS